MQKFEVFIAWYVSCFLIVDSLLRRAASVANLGFAINTSGLVHY